MESDYTKEEKKVSKEKSLIEEETSLLLSMVDQNILQYIFMDLVYQYEYCIYDEEEIKFAFTLLRKFPLTCKLFSNIAKQPLFPLILDNINRNLKYKKYLQTTFVKQQAEDDYSYKETSINTIFYHACFLGYYFILNTLIKYGSNINHKQEPNEFTPLMVTNFKGNLKTIQKLIKFENLNINQQDKYGRTALMWACDRNREDIVKILISRKDINFGLKNTAGNTALSVSRRQNYEQIITILQNYETSI